jgi:hypothetical protein
MDLSQAFVIREREDPQRKRAPDVLFHQGASRTQWWAEPPGGRIELVFRSNVEAHITLTDTHSGETFIALTWHAREAPSREAHWRNPVLAAAEVAATLYAAMWRHQRAQAH